jgi:hypothetical protein
MSGAQRMVRVHNLSLQDQVEHGLALLCAQLGCAAIEARAMWTAGDSTVVAQAIAGAAEGDKMRLNRWPRPPAIPPGLRNQQGGGRHK